MVAPRWTGLVAARLTRACILALCWSLVARTSHAGDPKLVWKTIETEHFVIHYYEPLLDVARRVAASAERSHTVLVPVFDHEPGEKTQIVITDDTDGANGFASVIPRNRIGLFATAPTSLSSLNDHDDWLYALVAHEYTHVLHLDSIGGLPRWINKIVGKTWAPNQVQPRWVIEGIATYQESEQSSGGRIRNALFDMDLRAVTLADQDHDLDAVTNLPRDWPRANAAYLYGSHFLKFVFDRHGRDALREMSWSYGSSPIPYGLNRAIREATGRTFEDLYADWRQHLRDKYSIQLEAVERRGRREGRRLTFTAETNRTPRYTLDGRHIVWMQSDGHSPGGLRRMPVGANAGKAQDYADLDRVGEYTMLSDGSMVVEQTNTYRSNYSYHDLFLWDRQTQTLRALTHGLRARDPAVSPDERRVAFVINGESRSRLAVMPLSPHAPHRILWEGEGRFDQVAAPAWSPDGEVIAFSAWSRGGYRDIWIIDVASGRAQRVTNDRAIDIGPVFSPDGAYLYYVSDRSGIYNVYALERGSNRHHQVTNVVGGAVMADVSPDGQRLVYQGFGVGGYDLYEMELDPARWLEPAPYVDDRPNAVEIREDRVAISAPRPYRPLETLAPRSYTVGLLTNSFGSAVNVTTGGGDIVGIHAYSLALTLGLDRPGVDIGASYSYGALWPSLRLAAARTTSRRSGVVIDGVNLPYDVDNYGLTASLGLPVLRTARGGGGLSFDYDVDWSRVVEDPYQEADPNDLLPRLQRGSRFAGVALRWSYSDARGALYSIGPQEGQFAAASLRLDHPSLGSDARALSLGYRWETYRKLPWSPTSSVAVHVAGGIRTNATRNPGNYSLGGVPEQDVVQSVLDSARTGSSGYLRGYERGAVTGRQYHLANIEYRQELLSFERGLATLPVFVRRLHVAGLLDVGNAFSGDFDLRDFKAGVGGSLRLDMLFGYFVPGSLDIGYARGLTSEGIGEYWLLLTGTL
jgi:Tol biopolymer transport system component